MERMHVRGWGGVCEAVSPGHGMPDELVNSLQPDTCIRPAHLVTLHYGSGRADEASLLHEGLMRYWWPREEESLPSVVSDKLP